MVNAPLSDDEVVENVTHSDDKFMKNATHCNDEVMENAENATHSDDEQNELSPDDRNEYEEEEVGGIFSTCKSIIFAGEKKSVN